jgi:excisionase family DNA binding protein
MEQILLNGISADELIERLVGKLDAVVKTLAVNNQRKDGNPYVSRKEACSLLKISLPTLNDWTKRGLLVSYRIGSRVLYKLDEVNLALDKRVFKKFIGKGEENA